jgi:hypothetical protein
MLSPRSTARLMTISSRRLALRRCWTMSAAWNYREIERKPVPPVPQGAT